MIINIISITATIFITLGLGIFAESVIEKIDPKTATQKFSIPILILIGLFLTSFILMVLHFFVQINLTVYIIMIFFSGTILFVNRKRTITFFSNKVFSINEQLLFAPFLIISTFALLFYSISSNYDYDLGLYHLQNINWFQNFAIVPGLGNLHGRFAFNSNWFLLESLFGNRQIFSQPIFPINIVTILAFIAFSLNVLNDKNQRFLSSKLVLLILLLSTFFLFSYANSASTDKPCYILTWIILTLFIIKIEQKNIQEWDKFSWAILLLSIFAFTIKVSSAILLLLPGINLLLSYKKQKKVVLYSFIISTVYLCTWFVRNCIISGTIIFPVSFLHLSEFDWSIPKFLVNQMTDVIYSWAIKPYTPVQDIAAMSFFEKIIAWQTDKTMFFNSILLIGFLGNLIFSFIDFIMVIKSKQETKSIKLSFFVLDLYMIIALTYWFFSAPDPRFAYGVIFASTALVISRIVLQIKLSKLFIDGSLLAILVILIWMTYLNIPWNNTKTYLIFPPTVPEYEIEEYTLSDGNVIFKPIEGDQCWDAPLPCSGWIYDGVNMRSSDLSDGFQNELLYTE